MTDTASDWSNYWDGRASSSGSALTGVEHDKDLQAVWQALLGDCDRSAPLLDLACGAGTVLKQAAHSGFTNLTGADYSAAAIDVLGRDLPQASGIVCSAHDTPFPNECYETIVSQFGFEYAGAIRAAKEISRILRPGGRFVAVSHLIDGGIYKEVEMHVSRSKRIIDSQFMPLTKSLFAAYYAQNQSELDKVSAKLGSANAALHALKAEAGQRFATVLLAGADQLWRRRTAYIQTDIDQWFDGMQSELNAYLARMHSMLDAALSDTEIDALTQVFQGSGCQVIDASKIDLGGQPAAWRIDVRKPS